MKCYSLASLHLADDSWVADYVRNVTPLVEQAGGRFLARTNRIEPLEGERRPDVVVLIEWPSREAAEEFYRSEAYAPWMKARTDHSRGELLLIAGHDVMRIAKT